MKQLLLISALAFTISNTFAQQDNCSCQSEDNYSVSLRRGLIGREYINPLMGFKGEQYFGTWNKGEVLFNNGDVIKDIDLLYEKYLDEVLWLRNSDFKIGILHKPDIAGFKLYSLFNNQIVAFIKLKTLLPLDVDSVDRYLQILELGKLTLCSFRKAEKSSVEYSLVDNTKYLLFNNGEYKIIKLRRSTLLNTAAIDKLKMKAILRSNTIEILNNEEGMVKAIRLYNQLPE